MTKIPEGRLFFYLCVAITFTLINAIGIGSAIYNAGALNMLKQCRAGYPPCMVPHVRPKPSPPRQYAPPLQEPPVIQTQLEGFALEDLTFGYRDHSA